MAESIRVWVAIAMKRSGHHAVLHNLCHQLSRRVGTVVHLNNCVLRGPLRRAVPKAGRLRRYRDGRVRDTGLRRRGSWGQVRRARDEADLLLYSFEDADPLEDYARCVIGGRVERTLLVIRDPFNWIASSMRFGGRIERALPRRIRDWKAQVRLGAEVSTFPYGPLTAIDFNRWVASRRYRDALSLELGLEPSERGRDEVVDFGGGSSFDGLDLDGRAAEMRVLERWRTVASTPAFERLTDDAELLELAKRFFGMARPEAIDRP